MKKENPTNQETTAKSSHHNISYEQAMEFDRQNQIAALWTPPDTTEPTFIEHLAEMSGIINSEKELRITELNKRKSFKEYKNGVDKSEAYLFQEHEN